MAITYPLTFPTGLFSSVRFRPRAVVGISQSPFTLQQQAQAHEGQIWIAELSINSILEPDSEELIALLLSLNGRQGTFLMGDPTRKTPRGSGSGSPQVDLASQTGQVLNTKGWTASAQGVLKKGDYIQLGSGATQRIYRVLKDINADGAGKAAVDIWPRLRESPADLATITLNNTAGVFRLGENEMPWDIDAPATFDFDLTAVEAI